MSPCFWIEEKESEVEQQCWIFAHGSTYPDDLNSQLQKLSVYNINIFCKSYFFNIWLYKHMKFKTKIETIFLV